MVSVTEGIQRGLITKVRGKARPEKFLVARNGISRLGPPRRSGPAAPFRIVYVGSFYHRRDPFPFLEGLADLIGERSLKPDDISIEFVGNCTEYRGVSVASQVRDLGLAPFVTIRGWIPHAEAQRLIEAADLLLFLAQDQPTQVPNKLYDYLGTGIPILAFTDAEGESAWMLRQAGGHFLVTGDDRAAAKKAIASAMSSTAVPAGGQSGVAPGMDDGTANGEARRRGGSLIGRSGGWSVAIGGSALSSVRCRSGPTRHDAFYRRALERR